MINVPCSHKAFEYQSSISVLMALWIYRLPYSLCVFIAFRSVWLNVPVLPTVFVARCEI